MKSFKLKLVIVFIAITFFVSTAWCLIFPPIEQAITAGGYVAVRLPANYGCKSFSLWTEDGAAYYIAYESDGSDAILVTTDGTNGFPFSMDKSHPGDAAGTILCYAKGTSSTNLVGLITQ